MSLTKPLLLLMIFPATATLVPAIISSSTSENPKAHRLTVSKPENTLKQHALRTPEVKTDTPLRIAAIVTTYFPNSHAGVMVDKFLRGFPTDDGLIPSRSQIVSLYIDQIHENDIGRQIAHEFDIPIYESIRSALTLGSSRLAVDAVLLIGEHGDYPRSQLGQEMVPRRYFFEQISGEKLGQRWV